MHNQKDNSKMSTLKLIETFVGDKFQQPVNQIITQKITGIKNTQVGLDKFSGNTISAGTSTMQQILPFHFIDADKSNISSQSDDDSIGGLESDNLNKQDKQSVAQIEDDNLCLLEQ